MNWLGAAAASVLTLGAIAGVYAGGFKAGSDAEKAKQEAAAVAGRKATERLLERSADVTGRIDLEHTQAAEQIRVVFKTIYREVPRAISAETDTRFPLPVGLVRLHDAAAEGLAPVPDAAGRPDDAPSEVKASDLAGAFVDNYEICHATARQLTDLQAWVRGQADAWGSPLPPY